MPHPLDGSHFKIIWAHQHLDELKRHIGHYFDHTPYTTAMYRQGDVTVVEAPTLHAAPHLDIGGLIGDCLLAAMSSLDYIIWEIASHCAERELIPTSLGGTDNISFPLYLDPAKWAKADYATNRAARYKIPAAVLRDIEAVQPYNAGYEPLWFLHVLVNQDKHRLPLLVEGHITAKDLGLSFGGQMATVRESTATSMAFNTPLDALPVERSHEMKVKAEGLTKFVAFGNPSMPREPVEVTLEKILMCVRNVNVNFVKHFTGRLCTS